MPGEVHHQLFSRRKGQSPGEKWTNEIYGFVKMGESLNDLRTMKLLNNWIENQGET